MTHLAQNANTEIAKDYISKRKIPELFESLLTGLMVHKPDDHIDFIIDSLARYKSENQALKWDLFIGHKGGVQTLAPLKKANAQNHDQPSTSQQQQQQQSMSYTATNGKSEHDVGGGLNRRAKLDSIPAGKHDAQKETKKVSIDTQRLKDKKLILVIGGPGSGKRTQSEKIAQKYNYIHISTADLIKSDSQSKDFPADFITDLVGEKMMTTADHTSGYVIDSQPNETRFGVTFERRVVPFSMVFYLDASDQILSQRLNKSRSNYNIENFHDYVDPLTQHYQDENKLVKVDASRGIDEVFKNICSALDKGLKSLNSPRTEVSSHSSERLSANQENLLKGKPILFVGGGPGSGKGTQCEKIIEKYGFTHLSAGDLIRAAVEGNSAKGKYFNEMMQQGKLISTEDILGLLKDAIFERAEEATGFLIDGFPRRIDQGIQFENDVTPCDLLIYFDLPDDIMTQRLVKRGETSGRIDDNEETIKKRLDTFHEQTTPLLGYYGKQGKLVTIDSNRSPDEIFEDVQNSIDRLMEQADNNTSHHEGKSVMCVLLQAPPP